MDSDPAAPRASRSIPPSASLDSEVYRAAVRTRDRLRARATWWEHWRATAMVPMIVAGALIGYGIGVALRLGFGLPDKADFFGAVIGIVVVGRAVTSYFDVSKLDVAQRRVDALAQELRRRR